MESIILRDDMKQFTNTCKAIQKFTSCLFLEDAKNNYIVKNHCVNSAGSNL